MASQLEIRGFHFHENDRKWIVKGVTYGPFRPSEGGEPFPDDDRLESDMTAIAALGANVIRVYTAPSERLAAAADNQGLRLLVDVPWPKHLDVYDDPRLRRIAFEAMEESISAAAKCPNLMGVLLGNEIPADIVRWAGPRKVEKFLREMYQSARNLAPEVLLGFANFPSTEYLPLGFFDFLGFNVYLSSRQDLRSYFVRLRNLYPDVPLILTETGEDSLSQGEEQQSRVVANALIESYDTGFAGGFIFSWTDEWHAGGYDINDWAFGIVDSDRRPKKLYPVAKQIFQDAPRTRLPRFTGCSPVRNLHEAIAASTNALKGMSRVSVVVASYNGGATLRPCLESLRHLNWPNFEVIVVNDGSSDNTVEILGDFPEVRAIHQENRGLSCARNAGIEAASGEIVAFTDSDCFVDPDWLHHLLVGFSDPQCAGVGGPNLTPREDNLLHRCVAFAPGHATHVLLDAERAEHVPGCNMAFRRDVLVEINGFDPDFRKAGDDVDLIWRLQELGYHIRFAPGAFVWHHRRSTIRAYLRQQAGYGEAEALLLRKHPHRFNDRGQSLWRGRIYTGLHEGALLQKPDVHYGVFASSGYQCIYTRPESVLTHFCTSLEWWAFCLLLIIAGAVSQAAAVVGIAGILIVLMLTALQARRRLLYENNLPTQFILVVWFLWITQPFIRTGTRYLSALRAVRPDKEFSLVLAHSGNSNEGSKLSKSMLSFWTEDGLDRIQALRFMVNRMKQQGWLFTPNNDWEPWDVSIWLSWSHRLVVTTMSEDHGAGKFLMRVRLKLRTTSLLRFAVAAVLIGGVLLALRDTLMARLVLLSFVLFYWWLHRHALLRRAAVRSWIARAMESCGYISIHQRDMSSTDSTQSADRKNSTTDATVAEEQTVP